MMILKAMTAVAATLAMIGPVVAHAQEKAAMAKGGHGAGNGGGAHYCPASDSRQATAEMYDLYEGREVWGYPMHPNEGTVESQLERALSKIGDRDAVLEAEIRFALAYMAANTRVVERKNFVPIADADLLMTDSGCHYAQLVNWNDRVGRIFVKQELLTLLDAQSLAAMRLHEAAYKVARHYNARSSDQVRQLVAQAFSSRDFDRIADIREGQTVREHGRVAGIRLEEDTQEIEIRITTTDPQFYNAAVDISDGTSVRTWTGFLKGAGPIKLKVGRGNIVKVRAMTMSAFARFHVEILVAGKPMADSLIVLQHYAVNLDYHFHAATYGLR